MKRTAFLLCTAALVFTMNIPVFAAQTKAEYKNETAQVRQELESTGNAIKSIQQENKEVSSHCSALKKSQKEAGTLKEHKRCV